MAANAVISVSVKKAQTAKTAWAHVLKLVI
jgi:hypothetical protein